MKRLHFSIVSCLCCFLFLFSAGISNASDLPDNETTLSNGFKVTFKGVTYEDDNETSENRTSTWVYEMEESSNRKDMTQWVLGLPECARVISADPFPAEINPSNSNSGLSGIEWDVNDDFEKETFTVVLEGQLKEGTVNVAAKGPNWARGEIAGPVCDDNSTEEIVGGSDDDQVNVIIDTKRTKKVRYKFKQAVKEGKKGKKGKVFLLLKVSGEPTLEPFVFARPSDEYLESDPESGYLRIILGPDGATLDFTDLYLNEQTLSTDTEDLDFDLGDLSGLTGLRIILVSAYFVEETSEFDIIQEVALDVK